MSLFLFLFHLKTLLNVCVRCTHTQKMNLETIRNSQKHSVYHHVYVCCWLVLAVVCGVPPARGILFFAGNWRLDSLKLDTQATKCFCLFVFSLVCAYANFRSTGEIKIQVLPKTSMLVVQCVFLQLRSGLHYLGFISVWKSMYHITWSLRSFRRFKNPLRVPIQRQQLSSGPYVMHQAQSSYILWHQKPFTIKLNTSLCIGCWTSQPPDYRWSDYTRYVPPY